MSWPIVHRVDPNPQDENQGKVEETHVKNGTQRQGPLFVEAPVFEDFHGFARDFVGDSQVVLEV